MVTRRKQRSVKAKYLNKIEECIYNEKLLKYRHNYTNNDTLIESLVKLKELVCSMTYEDFYEIKHLFPKGAMYKKHRIDYILNDTLIQREITFKLLDI
jgi:hypothetical protein